MGVDLRNQLITLGLPPDWQNAVEANSTSENGLFGPTVRVGGVGWYRGTSLIRKHPTLGPYSRPMPRALWWALGGGAVSYERGTPVAGARQGRAVDACIRRQQCTRGPPHTRVQVRGTEGGSEHASSPQGESMAEWSGKLVCQEVTIEVGSFRVTAG